jgi:hypothetical protein
MYEMWEQLHRELARQWREEGSVRALLFYAYLRACDRDYAGSPSQKWLDEFVGAFWEQDSTTIQKELHREEDQEIS